MATISGWNVSNIHYCLAEDTSRIGSVEFDLNSSATQVKIGLDIDSGRVYDCHDATGYHWLCEVNGVEVSQITSLRVIAIGQ
jgi:hypothetical protein